MREEPKFLITEEKRNIVKSYLDKQRRRQEKRKDKKKEKPKYEYNPLRGK